MNPEESAKDRAEAQERAEEVETNIGKLPKKVKKENKEDDIL